ncbi:MAG TPA: flagellar export protein FliJ [Desulfobacteraceae bacterium]|nr:flagellar export protein FliJ [Desulfobacteraceae bacterium]
MKRFRFRLEALLKYRHHLEYLAQQETAEAYRDVREAENEIVRLNEAFSRTAGEIDRAAAKGISARAFKQFNDYLDGVADDIQEAAERKQQLAAVLADKQKYLRERSVARKAIERLKEKQKQEYMDEFLKEEQKMLDEISSLKKAREVIDEG